MRSAERTAQGFGIEVHSARSDKTSPPRRMLEVGHGCTAAGGRAAGRQRQPSSRSARRGAERWPGRTAVELSGASPWKQPSSGAGRVTVGDRSATGGPSPPEFDQASESSSSSDRVTDGPLDLDPAR